MHVQNQQQGYILTFNPNLFRDQSDSSVSEPLAESSEEEVKKRKKKAPASRKPRKAVSE